MPVHLTCALHHRANNKEPLNITYGNKDIRIMTGYGPQENWDLIERTLFYTTLEEEISAVELQGRSVIISMDANAK